MKNRTGAQFKKLNRTPKHRENLMRNMTAQLVTQERIRTTVAKAKWLQFHANALIDHALQVHFPLLTP
jgi:ribosomal protein L17